MSRRPTLDLLHLWLEKTPQDAKFAFILVKHESLS